MAEKEALEELRTTTRTCPLIDNHAPNILLPTEVPKHPFEAITSEATGNALKHTFTSLPHLRAASQMRELYECESDADWTTTLQKRQEWLETRPHELLKKCR